MSGERVVVLGGGVAGMTAAHELAERGFTVDVYEARPALGGKAQSQYVAGSGRDGRRDLPGEHGFRFFPAFYRHVIDTMARIPLGDGNVRDNLRASSEAGLALADDQPVARFLRRLPASPRELAEVVTLGFDRLGISPGDSVRFSERVLRYYTSCHRRRIEQYETVSWWDFLGGERYSKNFQRYLAAIPRTMVAMDARRGSARTIGDISMQLLGDYGAAGEKTDRLLCGPTSETWIEPWRSYLEARGVRFHLNNAAHAIQTWNGAVSAIELADGTLVCGDQYVVAVPLEVLRPLITVQLASLDSSLGRLRRMPSARFAELTSWMNGVQFFLRRDVPIVRGHMFYPDAPWALTSISQPQFWRDGGSFESRYGDGSARGLISVDISDWHTPGTFVRKCARDCSPQEVADEVWQQLRATINTSSDVRLREDDLLAWHLDDELEPRPEGGLVNHAPLLVHPPNSWHYRPEAATRLPNLTLAADYVRTHTDLASMEGANEAARRAVNTILQRTHSEHERCVLWQLQEPSMFARAKQLDEVVLNATSAGRHAFDMLPATGLTLGTLSGALERLLGRAA